MEEYTRLSQKAYDKLLQNTLSPSEAVTFFIDNVPMRTFKDMLISVCQGEKMESRLLEGLFAFKTAFHELFLAADPKARPPVRDTIRRNISNWIKGNTLPQKRLDIFGICFALGLGINDADNFLRQASGYGFHMREPLEIALFYCLNSGKGIEESAVFIKGLDLSIPEVSTDANAKKTEIVEREFWSKVRDDESLTEFFDKSRSSFGKMHNTAFDYFKYYYTAISTLEKKEANGAQGGQTSGTASFENTISVGEVVTERLRLGVPLAENLEGYTQYQKTIRESWLGETSVKRILERRADVTRKAIILLYIATSGSGKSTYLSRTTVDGNTYDNIEIVGTAGIDDFSGEFDEWDVYDDLTPQQSLLEHTTHLDLILTDCGFARLDPRTPFDWLVLYSLCVNESDYHAQTDEFGLMGERLEGVLKLLFEGMSGNGTHNDPS